MLNSVDTNMESLTAEIQRVVTSPYPVSLKNLHVIAGRCNHDDIDRWAYSRPDHVPILATAVLDSLQSWPYTLDLLYDLLVTLPFRNSILSKVPRLLDQLVDKALTVDDVTSRYGKICMRLLNEPLPAEVPLPRNVQDFFLCVFDHSVQNPSSESLLPVYLLLDGACNGLLEILPSANLEKFQKYLVRIMKSVKSVEDHCLSLLCLAILSKIDRAHANLLDDTNSFYQGSRAEKTAHLLVLQVLFACKEEQSDSLLDARLRAMLARDVSTAIPVQRRKDFAEQNQSILRKLQDKVERLQPRSPILLESLAFLASFIEPSDVGSKLQDSFIGFATTQTSYRPLDRSSRQLLAELIKVFIPRLSHHHWLAVLQEALSECTQRSGSLAEKRQALYTLLPLIAGFKPFSILTAEAILESMRSAHIREQLEAFLYNSPVLDDYQRMLGSAICELLLTCALSYPSSANVLQPHMWTNILEKQKRLMVPTVAVDTISVHSSRLIRFCEQVCTPTEQNISHCWRTRLAELFENDDRLRVERVATLVGDICHNLEERCDIAEALVRELETKLDQALREKSQVENELKEAQLEKQKLQELLSQRTNTSVIVEEQLAITEEKLTIAHEEVQRVGTQLDDFKKCAEQERASDEEEHQRCQLELRAELACRVEQFDLCKEALNVSEVQLKQVSAKLRSSQEALQTLKLQLQESKDRSEAFELALTELQRDVEKSQEIIQELESAAKAKGETIQSLEQQADTLRLENQQYQQDSDVKLHDLCIQHEEELNKLRAELVAANFEHEETKNSLQAKTERLDQHAMLLQQTRVDKDMLQAKAFAHDQEKLNLIRELEKANEMRARLVAAMGSPRTPALKSSRPRSDTNFILDGHLSDPIAGYESAFDSSLTREEATPGDATRPIRLQISSGIPDRGQQRLKDTSRPSGNRSASANIALNETSPTVLNGRPFRQRTHGRTESETFVAIGGQDSRCMASNILQPGDIPSRSLSRIISSGNERDSCDEIDENDESTAEL